MEFLGVEWRPYRGYQPVEPPGGSAVIGHPLLNDLRLLVQQTNTLLRVVSRALSVLELPLVLIGEALKLYPYGL